MLFYTVLHVLYILTETLEMNSSTMDILKYYYIVYIIYILTLVSISDTDAVHHVTGWFIV